VGEYCQVKHQMYKIFRQEEEDDVNSEDFKSCCSQDDSGASERDEILFNKA